MAAGYPDLRRYKVRLMLLLVRGRRGTREVKEEKQEGDWGGRL
jgi:hypothetical protein